MCAKRSLWRLSRAVGPITSRSSSAFITPYATVQQYSSSSTDDLRKERRQLRKLINKYNYEYYTEAKPSVSDEDYDKTFQRLADLDKKISQYNRMETSPTNNPLQTVGAPVIKGVQHFFPMLSLANTYSEDEVIAFDKRIKKQIGKNDSDLEYTVEMKYDGVAISLIYEDGRLMRCITRGDGQMGEDITKHIRYSDIPVYLSNVDHLPSKFEIRGELIMSIENYELWKKWKSENNIKSNNNSNESNYSIRNIVAGFLHRKLPTVSQEKSQGKSPFLSAICYSLHYFQNVSSGVFPTTHYDRLLLLKSLGFSVDSELCKFPSVEAVLTTIPKFAKLRDSKQFPFPTDGIVVKLNDLETCEILGTTSRHPKSAIAFKFPSGFKVTPLLDVHWQISKTGKCTPVAEFEKIELNGSEIQFATLHNFNFIKEKSLKIGSLLKISKGGEVIPKVEGVVENSMTKKGEKEIELPKYCPCELRSKLVKKKTDLVCVTKTCPNQKLGKILFYCKQMNVDSIGEKTLEKLIEIGVVDKISDLYKLNERKEDILNVNGFGEKKLNKWVETVENSKHLGLATILSGLSVPHIGMESAKILENNFDFDDLINLQSTEQLQNVKGLGPVMSEALVEWVKENKDLLLELKEIGLKGLNVTKKKSSLGKNQQITTQQDSPKKFKVVLTGKMQNARSKIKEDVENMGPWEVSKTLGKGTTHLIVGEKPTASKIKKAEELGITIIQEADFFKTKQ